ncbi:MAG: hypothetical protein V4475_10640 [Pseudomonadota bacterium]
MRKVKVLPFLMLATLAATPAVAQQAGVFVKTGESVVFRLDHGQPVDVHPATGADKPAAGEIRVDLRYASGATTMVVANNSGGFLNYRAFIARDADSAGKATSVCTLMDGGRFAVENWPGQPFPGIRLTDFTPATQDSMVCQ